MSDKYKELVERLREAMAILGPACTTDVLFSYRGAELRASDITKAADAIEALNAPRWIATSERLPRAGQIVWACWYGSEVGPAKYTGHFWHHPDNDEDDYRQPDHWQPYYTPTPPEVK